MARPALAALLLLSGLALEACGTSEDSPPRSTILIVVDTLRADRLGAYGYSRDTSPEFDRWTEGAAVFERAIASSSWTLPSFASIYTGLHPGLHGAGEHLEGEGLSIAPIEEDVPTLAEILGEAGFATVAYANNPFLHEKFGVARGFDDYFFVPSNNVDIRTAEKTVDLALQWIDEHRRKSPSQPFFEMVHLFDPHMDYDPKAPFRGRFAGDYDGPLPFPVSGGSKMRMGRLAMSDADREFVAASYDEEIAYTDKQLGRFFAGLEARGLMDVVNVIFTSDHGEELFEHGSFEHGHSGYQEVLHIPLAISGPGIRAQRIDEPVSLVDLFPTILEASGITAPAGLSGQSLISAALGRELPPARAIVADRTLHGRRHRVLIRWPWKAIDIEGTSQPRLFHLERDPGELEDLSRVESVRLEEMIDEFEQLSPTPNRNERKRQAAALDETLRAQLEALGYATPIEAKPTSAPEPDSNEEVTDGRWVQPGGHSGSSARDDEGFVDRLLAIGYVRGSRPTIERGVTVHDRKKAAQGYNLYVSGHAPEALLIDMDGEVLHRWYFEFESAFEPPARARNEKNIDNTKWWRRVTIAENGDLYAIFEGFGLVKIDKDSNLIWSSNLHVHHDLEINSLGSLYTLTRKAHVLPRVDPKSPVLEDFITVFNTRGIVKREFSVLEALENSRYAKLADFSLRSPNGDLFHTNTVTILKGRYDKKSRAFAKGHVLVSMNRLGVVASIDVKREVVVWARKTNPIGQHDPKILANGNMLLFINNIGSGSSTVLEFDPATEEQIWHYKGSDEQPFYSKYLGAAARLWNGNTLISESDGGRAFEVTPDREIVWEFYNPNRAGEEEEFIATLPEVIRLPLSFPISWTDSAARSSDPDPSPH